MNLHELSKKIPRVSPRCVTIFVLIFRRFHGRDPWPLGPLGLWAIDQDALDWQSLLQCINFIGRWGSCQSFVQEVWGRQHVFLQMAVASSKYYKVNSRLTDWLSSFQHTLSSRQGSCLIARESTPELLWGVAITEVELVGPITQKKCDCLYWFVGDIMMGRTLGQW